MQNSDEQQYQPYEQRISPVASFVMRLAGFFLALIAVLALIAGWSSFLSEAATIMKLIIGLLLVLASGTLVYLAIDKAMDIRHKHRAELREAQRHDVQLHLLQTRIHANEQGNKPSLITATGAVINLPAGNFVQPVSEHFAPSYHNTYHYPKGLTQVTEIEQEQEQPLQIAAPADIPTFGDLLESGEAQPGERKSILGYTDGSPRRGDWQQLHSFFVVGLSGSGKSSTVAYYAALAVMHYARLLIIDPDADEEQSISQRLAPLSFAMLAPVASSPAGAARVIALARKELEHPSQYPVLLIIDEFSTIMRQGKMGGPWQEVAQEVASVAEEYAQRGRKRGRTCIAIGQIAKATRTGGTELRASMTATFIHRIPVQQARMVIDSDTAADAPTLATGECMVLLNNAPEPYKMNVPYAAIEDMHMVKQLMLPGARPVAGTFQSGFNGISGGPVSGQLNDVEATTESIVKPRDSETERVLQLAASGMSKSAIIKEIWNAKPGGSAAYKEACERYDRIMTAAQESEN